jgi:hypothetical protein
MPDLKFDGSIYFSANSQSSGHPLLVPMITNPDFVEKNSVPGIKELLSGNLGITEKILSPTIKPIIDIIMSNPLMVESISNSIGSNKEDKSALSKHLNKLYLPEDGGMKALEKTIITSMMESHKPLIQFLEVFLDSLGIAEDISCKYMGTSISVLGATLGIKSRSPHHWDKSLGYTETINHALQTLLKASSDATLEMNKSMSNKHPLKDIIDTKPIDKPIGDTDLPAYYVGYFDSDGNSIDPPLWVKKSNKWFSKQTVDRNGNNITVGAPFQQLSNDLNIGVTTLRNRAEFSIEEINNQKETLIKNVQDRLKKVELITDIEERENEIKSINSEKIQSLKILDDLTQTIRDVVDGTNISGTNYKDDNDLSKGVNSPAIINEWVGKSRGSQLRAKYYPEQKSTAQELLNITGKKKAPYVYIPTYGVNYNGVNYNVEVPLAFSDQIGKDKVYSFNEFYDSLSIDIGGGYSNRRVIKSLDLNPNDEKMPFIENNKTHYSNNIKNEYVPDNIKNYYLPLEWEEVSVYNTINKKTGEVISTETEYVPFKIDVENGYELRIIKVINQPLIQVGKDNNTENFFPSINNDIILLINGDDYSFIKINGEMLNVSIIIFNKNNFSIGRYIDENIFIENKYIYLRKDNNWDKTNIDSDDCEIYQIKDIKQNWIKKSITLINDVVINNTTKTISFVDNLGIPAYITEAKNNNFIVETSNNTYIKITKITNNTLYYDGELNNETINSVFKFQYLDSSNIETYQDFDKAGLTNVSLYSVSDLNYLPQAILNGDKNIIIQGFDKQSLYSTISGRIKNIGDDVLKYTIPNTDYDNIYKILDIKKTRTKKGIEIQCFNLDYKIPQSFKNRAYNSNFNSKFYFPLNFYTVSLSTNVGETQYSSDLLSNETGTLYATNNNIPSKMNLDNPDSTMHSTEDINEDNLLKEGIIYQGLDPRYVDRYKWKFFYLVEAVKKNDNGISLINNKINKNQQKDVKKLKPKGGSKGGKEWYGLMDKFDALPMVVTMLLPIITTKVVPLATNIMQTVSNPNKIKKMLLDIGIKNEDISKFPKNFKDFSFESLNKQKDASKKSSPKSLDENEKSEDKNSKTYYNGIQPNKINPKSIMMFDGQAFIEFGKGAFGSSIVNFGAELLNGEILPINSKDPNKKDQGTFNMILNFVKLPFEIIFKIFKWIVDWVKKLLNPAKIASAITEFLSFNWLLDIIGKKSIFDIMGLNDVDNPNFRAQMDKLINGISGEKAQNLFRDVLKDIRGSGLGFVEVLIYDILLNGNKIGEETETRPFNVDINNKNYKKSDGSNINSDQINDTLSNINNNNNNNNNNICGERTFSVNSLFPLPFFSNETKYTDCELPLIFLKPLEIIEGLLKMIQELLNGFLSMPIAILGLEPTINIPKFGKEIPFANVLTDLLNKLKSELVPIQKFS